MQSSGAFAEGLLILPVSGGCRSLDFKPVPALVDSKFWFAGGSSMNFSSICMPKLGIKPENYRIRSLTTRASANSGKDPTPIAPLQFESPTGEFLSQILQNHPHLLAAAIDQQLERLQTDRDAQNEALPPAADLLQRRILEVKEKERKKALEEIIYCLIIQKFLDANISMIPTISPSSDPTGRVDLWPNQERKLETVHSTEALEMIQTHLSLVLGDRFAAAGELNAIVQISKLRLGKLYAASIMYGYFLKRVDRRFQLERTMKTLPAGFDDDQAMIETPAAGGRLWNVDEIIQVSLDGYDDDIPPDSEDTRGNKLRSYVMYLDSETLQRYATIRSKEAISIIEKQTQAVFGRPDIRISANGSLDTTNDEFIGITLSGLTMLVLEAVAFGSFLWDAEDYVESKYHFTTG